MTQLKEKVVQASEALKEIASIQPKVGIVLGTGLGGLASKIEGIKSKSYADIPHFPLSTGSSHQGQMSSGLLGGVPVVAMEGRLHLYEGYSLEEITLPIRVMKEMGVELIVISNAAGGLNPRYKKGDLVLIEDHINLMGVNPLIGSNDDSLGPRFPDMIEPYSLDILKLVEQHAYKVGAKVHRGTYAAMTGPCLETRAEYRMLQTLGADLIGMSTVPEVIVAVHAGLKVLGLSIVTDMCLPEALKPVNIEEIIRTATEAEPTLCTIVEETLKELYSV